MVCSEADGMILVETGALVGTSIDRRHRSGTTPMRRRPDVSVIDTTEIRWFVPGALPREARRWFIGTLAAPAEVRRDRYLLDERTNVGLKLRNGEMLELKTRLQSGPAIELGGGFVGVVERWRKWTPADGLVQHPAGRRSLDVDKWIVKRRFALDGAEVEFSPVRDSGPFCDVEIVAIRAAGTTAWGFAFAAQGPQSGRLDAIRAVWRALLPAEAPTFSEVGLDRGESMGYPEWLSHRCP
jgi:hypothetical protein